MSTVPPPAAAPAYRDRSTALLLSGIFQILIGGLCGLMAPLMILGAMMGSIVKTPHAAPIDLRMMIPGAAFYLVLSVAFVWLGIGSIRARRWAWSLTVILSWLWLLGGLVGVVFFAFLFSPLMRAAVAEQPNAPPQLAVLVQIFTGGFLGCAFILLPAVFLLVYQRASVWATCERRDPQIRWTDRCPMPVLALSLVLAYCAASMPLVAVMHGVMPLFGVWLSGMAGVVGSLLLAVFNAWLAWGAYRLKMAAWWGILLFWIVGSISSVVTFSRCGFLAMYEKMQFPAAQLEMMRKSGVMESMSRWAPWIALVSAAVWLGYLLYVHRYFVHGDADEAGML